MVELLRRALLTLQPETAHDIALALSRLSGRWPGRALLRLLVARRVEDPVDLLGLRFPNRVGLAAGYDKNGTAWRGLAQLGFGHLELGTVTPRPQPGNPKPRVFRLREDEALVNRLGFPSVGVDTFLREVGEGRERGDTVIGCNIGKQKSTALDDAATDYELLVERCGPTADYLTVNISSPNTPGLRRLQDAQHLRHLVARVVRRRDGAAPGTPVLFKISPDLEPTALDEAVDILVDGGVDGIVATNTTRSREGISSPTGRESGGLSGRPLSELSTRAVERIATRSENRIPIVAVGGVMSGADAVRKRNAGASLVQVYTGLIYGGPALVAEVAAALAETPR